MSSVSLPFPSALSFCVRWALASDKNFSTKLSDLPAEAQLRVSTSPGSDMPEYSALATPTIRKSEILENS